ncbi:cell adhesion molecule DSCAM-like isoform X1 [Macrobrachium rosenbergii]|uniref:cell adhesion molecule DSCAM-like isoform X1 n=2 Tax=Macrobrachium rosenbergii TaxID=79674 RepID=UPI0034D79434
MRTLSWRSLVIKLSLALWMGPSPSVTASLRPNVVAEVPGLDVGPLVSVTVARGDTARLPCRHPRHPEDTVSLVLWYLNHTSRPFLSYDARDKIDRGEVTGGRSNRMSLETGGTSLVIREVRKKDQAEYRCRVHFRMSPTWTQRLLLTVPEIVMDVELTDGTGRPLEGPRVGPLPEGSSLVLACQANHRNAQVINLVWLLEGVPIDTTWASAEEDVAINQLTISDLEPRHRNAHLTCRLETRDSVHFHVTANITDASLIISMFYVPETTLIVEGGRRSHDGGGGREVIEGKSVTFLCSVKADPPAYNITWLHNGRVVAMGGRRWRRDNTSLVITPVTRDDSGLYTCLASNSEGDGHSNAILLRVAHIPYCAIKPQNHMVVAVNTTITLSCQMEAVPKDLTFTWTLAAPSLKPAVKDDGGSPGGVITGDRPHRRIPSLIDLTPGNRPEPDYWNTPAPVPWEDPFPSSWKDPTDEELTLKGYLLRHRVDPSSPAKSQVTITPTVPSKVICYARNRVGLTRVPCTYTLNVVKPPDPLQNCTIAGIGETRIEVKCDTPGRAKGPHTHDHATHMIHHSPSLSFVRSPEASPRANLEVWSGGTLVANVSNTRPEFSVRGLPPAAPLKLVLYSATAHTRSTPVVMYGRTLPRTTIHLKAAPQPTDPKPKEQTKNKPADVDGMGGLGVVIGVLVGGVSVTLLILAMVIMIMKQRQRRMAAEDTFDHPPDSLPEGSSQEILALDAPSSSSPPVEPSTSTPLPDQTPPPPRMRTSSNERLCRSSKESMRSTEVICQREGATTSRLLGGMDLARIKGSFMLK